MFLGNEHDPQSESGEPQSSRPVHTVGQQPPPPWYSGLVLPSVALALMGLAVLGGCVLFIIEPSTKMQLYHPRGGPLQVFVFIFFVGLIALLFGIFSRDSTDADAMEGFHSFVKSGSRINGYLVDQAESHEVAGSDFEVIYRQPRFISRGILQVASLRISVSTKVPTSLGFSKESSFDCFCKRFGIANEHVMGDTEFDDYVYISGASDGYADVYLKDEHKRQAIRELLQSGFDSVGLHPQGVSASWTGFNPAKRHQTDLCVHAAKCLMTLADEIPQWSPQHVSSWKDGRFTMYALVGCLLVAFLSAGTYSVPYPPVRSIPRIPAGILLFAFVSVVFGVFSAWMLRGRSTSHLDWCAVVGLSLLTLLPTCIWGIAAVNGHCDRSTIEIKTAPIVAKRISRAHHFVDVADWTYSGVISFRVNKSEYHSASRAELEIGRGALGIEWLKTKRFLQ